MVRVRPRMVCFDAGGVLVRICRSWREGCEAAGVRHRWNEEAEAGEARRRAINEEYQQGRISCDEFFARMAATSGGLYAPEDIRRVHDAWILDEYPRADTLVRRLNAVAGLETGLLSNTSASHWAHRLMLGGRGVSAVGLVKHPHASHVLGLVKPRPEIYAAFERETGVRAGEILFFDDLAENVASARAAGWRAELVDYLGDTCAQIERHLHAHGVLGDPDIAQGRNTYNPGR